MANTRGSELLATALASSPESVYALEKRLRLANGTIGKLVTGKRGPGRSYAAVLTQAFGIPPGAWDEPAEPQPTAAE